MFCYRVKINSQPKIKFACSTTTDRYKNIFNRRRNLIEISTADGAGYKTAFDDGELFIPPKSLNIAMPDLVCRTYAAAEGNIIINTAAMEISNMEYERIQYDSLGDIGINENENGQKYADYLMLPYTMPIGDDYVHVTAIIKALIGHYMKNTVSGYYLALSSWNELLAYADETFRRRIYAEKGIKKIPSSEFYIKKAKRYISERFCGQIRLSDIAGELGITPNYLGEIFKSGTGRNIPEYVNMLRVQKVRELVYEGSASAAEIAEAAGFGSVRYMQRIFKKYCGVSVTKSGKIDRELTLYHQKPWNVEKLDHDPFGGDVR